MEFSFAPVPDASTRFLQQLFPNKKQPASTKPALTKAVDVLENEVVISHCPGTTHNASSLNSSALEALMRFI